jgi:hypothetical protein
MKPFSIVAAAFAQGFPPLRTYPLITRSEYDRRQSDEEWLDAVDRRVAARRFEDVEPGEGAPYCPADAPTTGFL